MFSLVPTLNQGRSCDISVPGHKLMHFSQCCFSFGWILGRLETQRITRHFLFIDETTYTVSFGQSFIATSHDLTPKGYLTHSSHRAGWWNWHIPGWSPLDWVVKSKGMVPQIPKHFRAQIDSLRELPLVPIGAKTCLMQHLVLLLYTLVTPAPNKNNWSFLFCALFQ